MIKDLWSPVSHEFLGESSRRSKLSVTLIGKLIIEFVCGLSERMTSEVWIICLKSEMIRAVHNQLNSAVIILTSDCDTKSVKSHDALPTSTVATTRTLLFAVEDPSPLLLTALQ